MDDEISIKALRYDAIVNELYRKGMDTGIGFYGIIEFIKHLHNHEDDDPFKEDNWGANEDEPYDDDPDCTRSDVGIFYK